MRLDRRYRFVCHTCAGTAYFNGPSTCWRVYGDFTQGQWLSWIARATERAPAHVHLHANVDQDRWVSGFSRYDAGWLHALPSDNNGELRWATWDDLNYPARIGPFMAAGVPLLQTDDGDSIVATQALAHARNLGLFINSIPHLEAQLRDRTLVGGVRDSV